jgi:mannose-6-phosphate isomerase-like protein (cupin superfamily)
MTPPTDTSAGPLAGRPADAAAPAGPAAEATFDLTTTYVVARPDGDVPRIPVDDSFWPEVMAGGHPELNGGWMIGAFDYTSDWDSWERHPIGDEIVTLLAGRVEMVLDLDGRQWSVPVEAGRTVIVPRGAWHRAIVHEPGRAIHITLGEGTHHRPYDG